MESVIAPCHTLCPKYYILDHKYFGYRAGEVCLPSHDVNNDYGIANIVPALSWVVFLSWFGFMCEFDCAGRWSYLSSLGSHALFQTVIISDVYTG